MKITPLDIRQKRFEPSFRGFSVREVEAFLELLAGEFEEVVNASVNQTLSRTMLTSLSLLIAIVALLMFGGEKLNPMSFTLLVGVSFGTYSSVFVAAALLVIAARRFGSKYVNA